MKFFFSISFHCYPFWITLITLLSFIMGADFSKLKLIGWIHFALLVLSILAEAEAKSPTGGYSPGYVSCPSENIVRPADVCFYYLVLFVFFFFLY